MAEQLTVGELIDELKKFPKDKKVVFYERGAVFDSPIHRVYESARHNKQGRYLVILG